MSQPNPFKNRTLIICIIFTLAGLGIWLSWSKSQTIPVPKVSREYPVTINDTAPNSNIAASEAASIPDDTKSVFSCMIEPEQTVEIRSSVTGVVDKITVGRGDNVTKGQVLVVLDAAVAKSTVAGAHQRAQAQAQIDGARKKLALANVKADRMEQMYRQEFVSAQARDDALNERNIAAVPN
ncbi:biotin/lipoyl-binding protein [Kingella potus]|uniref:biotin/lipoyl-binding protein n=1 Tax=Kingella potus TaxID=265175 RepID=UPI001FCFE0F6|nr:biotin/lipoyl-binding protein [Kingella potus]UOP01731.1 biotin/lipoyl-binding protein [Kingella potus]